MARKKTSQGRKPKKKRPASGNADTGSGALTAHAPPSSRSIDRNGGSGGAAAGPVPNLFWGYVSMEELRACSRFVGLPELPQPQQPLPCLAAARYLRQDSPSWRQLHAGVLSTGLLKEALGLREPLAARVVGGRNESSHAPLVAAFQHLRQAPQLPPPGPEQEASWRRGAVRDLEEAQRRSTGPGQQLGPGPGPEQGQGQERQAPGPRAGAEEAGEESAGALCHPERYCRSAAALSGGGLVGVRCAWGKVQEAAALAQLLHIFPGSYLHEVGLCCVPPGSPALASLPGLPPLAASPDALIAHPLTLPRPLGDQLLAAMGAAEEAAQLTAAAARATAAAGGETRAAAPGAAAAAAAARLQQLLRELLAAVPVAVAAGGPDDRDADAEDGCEGGEDGGGDAGMTSAAGRSSGDGDGDGDGDGGAVTGEDALERFGGRGEEEEEEEEGEEAEEGGEEEESGSVGDSDATGGGGCGDLDEGDAAEDREGAESGGVSNVTGLRSSGRTAAAAAASPDAGSAGAAAAAAAVTAASVRSLRGELLAAVLEARLPALVLCGDCGGGGHAGPSPQPSTATTQQQQQQQHPPHQPGGAPEVDTPDPPPAGRLPRSGSGSGSGSGTGPQSSGRAMTGPQAPLEAGRVGGVVVPDQGAGAGGSGWSPDGPVALWCECRGGGGGGGSGSGGGAAVNVVLREVVEVKNTCPFGMRQFRRGSKGRVVREVVLGDRGPRQALSPLWVPQLQLHMLATGCRSGLLVSRSATKGTTVFRLLRDDAYLERMLGLLERFNTEYVRRGVSPPRDMFSRLPDYAAFLGATARLARTAVLLTGGTPWRPPPPPSPVPEGQAAARTPCGGRDTDGDMQLADVPGRFLLDRDEAFLRRDGGG